MVLVEQAEVIAVDELNEFIRANNPHDQQIIIIGGAEAPDRFRVVPWDKVTNPTPSETAWMEIVPDVNYVSRGYRGYDGVVLKSGSNRIFPPHPVFVRDLELRHHM